VRACSATSGKVERVPGCEGLVVDLDALWREVDRLLAPDQIERRTTLVE
jgi:hypothetical protein